MKIRLHQVPHIQTGHLKRSLTGSTFWRLWRSLAFPHFGGSNSVLMMGTDFGIGFEHGYSSPEHGYSSPENVRDRQRNTELLSTVEFDEIWCASKSLVELENWLLMVHIVSLQLTWRWCPPSAWKEWAPKACRSCVGRWAMENEQLGAGSSFQRN